MPTSLNITPSTPEIWMEPDEFTKAVEVKESIPILAKNGDPLYPRRTHPKHPPLIIPLVIPPVIPLIICAL